MPDSSTTQPDLDLSYICRDLVRLVAIVEQRFYDKQNGVPSEVVVDSGAPGSQPPCSLGELDTLQQVDSLLADLPSPLREHVLHPVVDTPSPRSRSSSLFLLGEWVELVGGVAPGSVSDPLVHCWTQIRRDFGLWVVGQRSLHEPMSIDELVELLGRNRETVQSWIDDDLLVPWSIAGRVLWQIPRLGDLRI